MLSVALIRLAARWQDSEGQGWSAGAGGSRRQQKAAWGQTRQPAPPQTLLPTRPPGRGPGEADQSPRAEPSASGSQALARSPQATPTFSSSVFEAAFLASDFDRVV